MNRIGVGARTAARPLAWQAPDCCALQCRFHGSHSTFARSSTEVAWRAQYFRKVDHELRRDLRETGRFSIGIEFAYSTSSVGGPRVSTKALIARKMIRGRSTYFLFLKLDSFWPAGIAVSKFRVSCGKSRLDWGLPMLD